MKNLIETLEKYYEDGLLYKQTHPTLPLTIWNYKSLVQYDNLWSTHPLLLQTRGLVTDDEGNIVARPFKKFFNIEEGKHTPTSEFEVYEKMDGSLGIMFEYNGQMVCATRGSFTSDQSKWMTDFVIKNNYQNLIVSGLTYLFEIIYPENRIVVDYQGQERLVLLGIINTETGEEVPYEDIFEKFDVVKKHDGIKDYTKLKSLIDNNAEGFVVRFSNGDRMKIKGEEYLRLHKIMTNVSTTGIWEMLSNGDDVNELLKEVPDEFYKKIKDYVGNLKYNHYQISEYCGKIHDEFRYGKYNDVEVEPTKKEYAQHIFRNYDSKYHPILFAMWDKKNYDKIIWNTLKPEFSKL